MLPLETKTDDNDVVIDCSPKLIERFKEDRNLLKKEAQKLGKLQADRLAKIFYKMLSSGIYHRSKIIINEATLLRLCVAYWEDILRIKAYHIIDVAEKYKKASYMFKWITKMRPVKAIKAYPQDHKVSLPPQAA